MISLCKHSHIVLPPAGSIFSPADCQHCGITWEDAQAELRRQELALIHGTSHDGECPHCGQTQRLYRFQPPEQPWHEVGDEPVVTWLCIDGYDAAVDEVNAAANALLRDASPRPVGTR